MSLQELHAFEGDGFRSGRDVPPDGRCGGELAQRKAEALDGEPAVVIHSTQSFKHVVPLYMPCSRNAAIVLAGVNVLEVRRDFSKRMPEVLFLDVGMEGIEQNADPRLVKCFAQRYDVFRSIQEV